MNDRSGAHDAEGPPPTYAVLTIGCRVNQADSLELERNLRSRGLRAVEASAADLVIVNTCAVTAAAEQGARQAIRRVHRDNAHARIVVTGCYATHDGDALAALPGVIAVLPNGAKPDLAAHVSDACATVWDVRNGKGDGPCGAPVQPGVAGRTAWTLRVQTGCDQPCAYCIIPRTRGTSQSRPLREVLSEVEQMAGAGFREIALTGVHLGAWGRDLPGGNSLATLLRALAGAPADVTFRVSSLEPMDCTPEVLEIFTCQSRFAPHFHLPMQHASDRVLAAMQRPYRFEMFDRIVRSIREALPHASIGTDVLVGFPGEHDQDHATTITWLETSPLTHLHVFPYSDRPGTLAATLPGKVHGAVIRQRAEQVRAVGRRLAERFRGSMVGSIRPALTLEDGTLAVTDNYLKVRIAPGLERNERVLVRITSAGDVSAGQVVEVERRGEDLPVRSGSPHELCHTLCG